MTEPQHINEFLHRFVHNFGTQYLFCAPQTLKSLNLGFRLGGASHKVDLLRRPANSYKTPAKPQMYAHTHL